LHARLAGRVAPNRWWALTSPFHPLPAPAMGRPLAGLLSVAVVVTMPLPAWRPHLLFREATLPPRGGGESGSSSTGQRPAAAALHLSPDNRIMSKCFNIGHYSIQSQSLSRFGKCGERVSKSGRDANRSSPIQVIL